MQRFSRLIKATVMKLIHLQINRCNSRHLDKKHHMQETYMCFCVCRTLPKHESPFLPPALDLKCFFSCLSCSIIFVNNFAFGPEVDHQLKERFANMKEGEYFSLLVDYSHG